VVALVGMLICPTRLGGAQAPSPGAAMTEAARHFLQGLTPSQVTAASFSMDDAHRVEWYYVPRARRGLPRKQMDQAQRRLADGLVRSALSDTGIEKTNAIMGLEFVLARIEGNPVRRDPELYYTSVFGTPGPGGAWGWRVEGHHLSLNFTIVDGAVVSTTPRFFGANPARVDEAGPLQGQRVLHDEEDLGRALFLSLDESQKKRALIADEAPSDILTKQESQVRPLEALGLAAKAMRPRQAAALTRLIECHAASLRKELVSARLDKIRREGFAKILFAWAGGTQPGEGHYYRIQGPSFLIEYDNTQNGANHAHVVWRDFTGDFGRDLLREHHERSHGKAGTR
jgi:hypothetical protein